MPRPLVDRNLQQLFCLGSRIGHELGKYCIWRIVKGFVCLVVGMMPIGFFLTRYGVLPARITCFLGNNVAGLG
jgi:hypothetical protein